ncbi:MAG: tRNA epoxyqueuosine(34) reductase QueG [Phycisphaeraceae bacterium]|nr:tRNA epoxyqueuosine(34) reductase QueG [Phycisphaeraceae bacterium]
MSSSARDLTRRVVEACRAMGFAGAGVCRAAPSAWDSEVRAWLGAGKHGTMDWLEASAGVRLDVGAYLKDVRSVIVVMDQHARADEARMHRRDACATGAEAGGGRIARYARGGDYHTSMSARLRRLADALRREHEGAGFRAFVDVMPVLEREHAQRAGLGWIGKHTLLIHPELGSYTTLGGIATTLELEEGDGDGALAPVTDHCGACTRCIDACPTSAITPYSVDATKCVSYLTIEHDGRIDPSLHEGMGDWLIGCDVCQEVCPHNHRPVSRVDRGGQRVNGRYLSGASVEDGFDLLELLGWTEADRSSRLTSSAIKRLTLRTLKRNALIAAGNRLVRAEDVPLEARVRAIAADEAEDELVRQTARDVVDRLSRRRPSCSPQRTS